MSELSKYEAPEGQIWVCGACGKKSKNRAGDSRSDFLWDSSCFMNSVLVFEDSIELNENGRVAKARAVDEDDEEKTSAT